MRVVSAGRVVGGGGRVFNVTGRFGRRGGEFVEPETRVPDDEKEWYEEAKIMREAGDSAGMREVATK